MNIREQLDDINFKIGHYQSMVRGCKDVIKDLRVMMKEKREFIKELKKKRRRLIRSTVGIHV